MCQGRSKLGPDDVTMREFGKPEVLRQRDLWSGGCLPRSDTSMHFGQMCRLQWRDDRMRRRYDSAPLQCWNMDKHGMLWRHARLFGWVLRSLCSQFAAHLHRRFHAAILLRHVLGKEYLQWRDAILSRRHLCSVYARHRAELR